MKPEKGSSKVEIALTMDIKRSVELPLEHKMGFAFLGVIGSIIIALAFSIVLPSAFISIIVGIVIVFLAQFMLRRFLIKEHVYKKTIMDLEKADKNLPYINFVNILSVEETMPYLVRFDTGHFGYYIRLEKGTKVGRGIDGEYNHHEAVANALKFFTTKGLSVKRADYMENNSTDNRLHRLKTQYEKTPDTLKKYLYEKYNYLEKQMDKDALSHDMLFVYTNREDVDASELFKVLVEFSEYFTKANYSRVVLLSQQEVESTARTILNSDKLNFVDISNQISQSKQTNFLRKIYTISYDGVKTKHNQTMEELQASKRIQANERKARWSTKFKRDKDDDNIDW